MSFTTLLSAKIKHNTRVLFNLPAEEKDVSAGSVIFVAAEVEHRFYDIVEELEALVFFAPAESE
jgi:hypothetical protein